jgi:hypothetical protein
VRWVTTRVAPAVEQLAHRAPVRIAVDFIRREVIHVFVDVVRDRELKKHLFMGGKRSLNDSLNQAL